MYVLDTNTVIYFFRDQGRVADNLRFIPPSQVGIPSIVAYELETGVRKSGSKTRRGQLDRFLAMVRVLPFGHHEAGVAARVRADLESAGTPIGPYDILIAATALSVGGILVTNNTAEFGRVAGLELANWR